MRKLSKTKSIFIAMGLFSSLSHAAGLEEILTMQNWSSSGYHAICADGSKELLNNIDIKLNNACPKGDTNAANNILVMHQLVSGKFDVTCVDMSRFEVSLEEIINSRVCADHGAIAFSDDLLNGQVRNDGNFDLVCSDGSKEVVSPQDIRLDNFCPKQNLNHGSRNILTMFRKQPGTFEIHCLDGSEVVVNADQLRANDSCETFITGPKPGEYVVESGYPSYCRQRFVSTISGREITDIKISFIGACSGTTVQLHCNGDTCTTSDKKYTVKLIDETHYQFDTTGTNRSAIFRFYRDIQEFTKVSKNTETVIGENIH